MITHFFHDTWKIKRKAQAYLTGKKEHTRHSVHCFYYIPEMTMLTLTAIWPEICVCVMEFLLFSLKVFVRYFSGYDISFLEICISNKTYGCDVEIFLLLSLLSA